MMKVILQEKVANLGNVGDQVSVKPGFGRNYLIPYGKAVPSTPEAIADFEKRRAGLEKAAAELLATAKQRADKLADLTVTLSANAGEEGKLFGSISPRDIAEAITRAGVDVEKREVDLPEGPIRTTGEYEVHVHLHSDVKATVKLVVKAE